MDKWLLLMVGGACGAVGRYVVSVAIQRWWGTGFPYGTLIVNLIGCVVIGIIGTWAEHKLWLNPHMRLVLIVGFLGAFTTFSTFIYESWQLLQQGELLLASVNVVGSVLLGVGALWVGARIASLW